jgi:hypothetical protein
MKKKIPFKKSRVGKWWRRAQACADLAYSAQVILVCSLASAQISQIKATPTITTVEEIAKANAIGKAVVAAYQAMAKVERVRVPTNRKAAHPKLQGLISGPTQEK